MIAQYHEFVRLGREGYRLLHQASHSNAQYVAKALGQMGPFQLIHDGAPEKGIYDLADRLRMRGWQVPAYPFTGDLAHQAFQRILVKRDFTREMADLLLDDLRTALAHFQKHPITSNLQASEAASYNHL